MDLIDTGDIKYYKKKNKWGIIKIENEFKKTK